MRPAPVTVRTSGELLPTARSLALPLRTQWLCAEAKGEAPVSQERTTDRALTATAPVLASAAQSLPILGRYTPHLLADTATEAMFQSRRDLTHC